ncbi:hypothetical protein JTE90_005710 [Oedothorax gibbosus]|uniref:Retrotransposon gag domain-containing protein n=1 Tax=Oedothorax gibbosus TaxID=931172 RepID=A0AAV6TM94_9ARAC|nr:hypothetical protein JTE90_005710 [Oedothorax gibbosus]
MSTLRDQVNITFQELKTAIATHFKPCITIAQGISKLTSAIQGPSESVQDFAVRVEGLAKSTNAPADFTTQLIFSQFISGLRQDIKTQIHIQNPRDFTEALQTAIRVEKAFKDITQNVNSLEASASTRAHESDKNAFITVIEALNNMVDSLAKQKPAERSSIVSSAANKAIAYKTVSGATAKTCLRDNSTKCRVISPTHPHLFNMGIHQTPT